MLNEGVDCKLFVGGMSFNTNESSFKAYFSQFGNVSDAHIKRDEQMKPKGFGVITFADPAGVEATVAVTNHYLDGKRIDPKRFNFQAYTVGTLKSDSCKLFVGGLTSITTEDEVRRYFEALGAVRAVLLKKDPATGKGRGFAFVTLESADGVAAVLKRGQHVINGKSVDVKAFKGKPGKIFVGAISRECSDEEVREYFNQFGVISEFNLPADKNNLGKNKGFCFITYESEDSVRACLAKDPHPVIHGKAVDIKKAVQQEKADGSQDSMGYGGSYGSGAAGCPYCGGPGPVINVPTLWPPVPVQQQGMSGYAMSGPYAYGQNVGYQNPGQVTGFDASNQKNNYAGNVQNSGFQGQMGYAGPNQNGGFVQSTGYPGQTSGFPVNGQTASYSGAPANTSYPGQVNTSSGGNQNAGFASQTNGFPGSVQNAAYGSQKVGYSGNMQNSPYNGQTGGFAGNVQNSTAFPGQSGAFYGNVQTANLAEQSSGFSGTASNASVSGQASGFPGTATPGSVRSRGGGVGRGGATRIKPY